MKKRRIMRTSLLLIVSLLFGTFSSTLLVMAEDSGAVTKIESEYFHKYDPTITLTTHTVNTVDTMYQDGGDAENNAWTEWIEENLGITWKMKWVAPNGETDAQKLDLAFATDDLPDVINASKAQLARFVAAGKLVPLNDLIEEYASPLVKWAIEDAEVKTKGALFSPFMQSGQIYAMPVMKELMDHYNTNFIRKDILDEMEFEIPQTLEEFEVVLEAYKENYPGGYGLGLDNTLSAMAIPMASFAAFPQHWVMTDEGIRYGSIMPEAKEALAKMAEWYEKGYIDPEFVVKDNAKLQEDVIQGNVLVYYGHWASIAAPFNAMWGNIENSDVVCMPNLTGYEGQVGVMANTWFDFSRAITVECENPEALFYHLNRNWDSYYRNREDLRKMMKEEYDYDFAYPVTEVRKALNVDEVAAEFPGLAQPIQLWKYDYPEELQGANFFNNGLTHYNSNLMYGFIGEPVSLANSNLASMAEAIIHEDESLLIGDGLKMYDEWTNTNPKMLSTFATTYTYWSEFEKTDNFMVDAFSGAPTPTMTEKKAYLDKLELETYTKIIMGALPIEAFDDFVEEWMTNGGEEITKEVNTWHDNL